MLCVENFLNFNRIQDLECLLCKMLLKIKKNTNLENVSRETSL